MRLTVDDCIEKGINHKVKVFLNGESINKCVMADEEKGIVELVDTENIVNDDLKTYFAHGRVRIVY